MAASMANAAQQSPGQGPLAAGLDGDAFAASLLVEPGPADQVAPAEPSQDPAEAARSAEPAAAPGPQPVDTASDELVAGLDAAEQPPMVDVEAVPPAFASGELNLPAQAPEETPAGDRRGLPQPETDAVEPSAEVGQREATPAAASSPGPAAAAEPDSPPAHDMEQPADPQSAPLQAQSDVELDVTPDSAVDVNLAAPPEMPDAEVDRPSGEPAALAQDEPPETSLPEPAEAAPAGDHEAWHDADAVVSVGVQPGSTAEADDGRSGDAAAAPIADEMDIQQPGRPADPEPPLAEGAQPAGADPAAAEQGALPDSAGGSEAAEEGASMVPSEPTRHDDHFQQTIVEAPIAADPDRQAAAGRGLSVLLKLRLFGPLIMRKLHIIACHITLIQCKSFS